MMYVKKDGTIYNFCSSKCKKNNLGLGREARGLEPAELAQIAGEARRADAPRAATWIDAWRGEVFAALYEEGRLMRGPAVCRPSDELDAICGVPTRFVGDGAAMYREQIERAMGAQAIFANAVAPLLAGSVATSGSCVVTKVRSAL